MSHLSPYLCPLYVDFPVLSHPIMSMTSTVTASIMHESTLGNEYKIANCICILVATHWQCIPFSHESLHEEDLVELCVGLGQTQL